jgi:hypothetical protein
LQRSLDEIKQESLGGRMMEESTETKLKIRVINDLYNAEDSENCGETDIDEAKNSRIYKLTLKNKDFVFIVFEMSLGGCERYLPGAFRDKSQAFEYALELIK